MFYEKLKKRNLFTKLYLFYSQTGDSDVIEYILRKIEKKSNLHAHASSQETEESQRVFLSVFPSGTFRRLYR